MEEFKSLEKYRKKHGKVDIQNDKHFWKSKLISFVNRIFLSAFLLLGTLILIKVQPSFKEQIQKNVFDTSLSFAQMNQWFEKNFGGVNPFDFLTKNKDEQVFHEKLVYKNQEKYKEGVRLTVGNSYLIPNLESGIVVFIGDKEGYGKTVIIQQVNGIDLWYSNVTTSLKLYDYVEKGKLIGESITDEIYLTFQKAGEYLNYQDYLT